jgi:hypothetical protein
VSFSGEASNHQGARFEKSGNEASDVRQPRLPFRAKSFENVLVEKKKRLDGLDAGCLVDDREVPVLDAVAERILKDFVVTVILAPVGEGGGPSGATGDLVRRDGVGFANELTAAMQPRIRARQRTNTVREGSRGPPIHEVR